METRRSLRWLKLSWPWLVAGMATVGIYLLVAQLIGTRVQIHVTLRQHELSLLAPRWLYGVAVAPLFFVLRRYSLTDLTSAQQVMQALLRSFVVAGLCVALARPVVPWRETRKALIVLVDVSDSISEAQLQAQRAYVEAVWAARGDGVVRVITFAERPRLLTAVPPLGATIARHPQQGAGSDIVAAMRLAYGVFPDGYVPNLVVLSDGAETKGDIATEALRARDLGITVSVRSFASSPVPEVRVAALRLPDEVKMGQPFYVTAEIWSSVAQTVGLALQQDQFPNALEPTKQIALTPGANTVQFKSEAKRAGTTTYRLRITRQEADSVATNNAAVMSAHVKGRPHILYIEGGVLRDANSASYFAKALTHENIDVDIRPPSALSGNAKDLEPYDLVVFSDVPAHVIGAGQMQALDAYVSQYGGGLIVAGGQDSFGSGGYQGTRLEQMMPVRFDSEKSREQPDVALALVIDRSGSMNGPKLEAAKESARVTAEVLSPNDVLSVVAFDTDAAVYVRPQRAANRMRISAEISRLQSGGGTNIYPGLRTAFEILNGVNAKVKHVIVLSDGEAPADGLVDLVRDMRAARITVSCVGVTGADRALLTSISDAGDGRLYMVEDIGALPKIFMKETMEAQKAQLVEDAVMVRVAKRVEAIDGTGVENAPPLRGYVSTKPKPTAETILISDLGEPILARWRRGAGQALAWTSDVKNRWSVDWIRWAAYPKFWAQVVRSAMRRQVYNSYDLQATVVDGAATVTVDAIDTADRFVNELDSTLYVIDPATDAVLATMAMQQNAPGRYTAHVRLDRYGSLLLKAEQRRDGKVVAESFGAVALSYPIEYTRQGTFTEGLYSAANVTGGLVEAAAPQLWQPDQRAIVHTRDLWPLVVLVVIGLFVLDLFAKRTRWFGYRVMKFR